MRYWQKTKFTWAAIQCRQVSFYAHLFALLDTIFKSKEPWIATGAKNKSKRYDLFLKVVKVHTYGIAALLIALIIFRSYQGYDFVNFLPLIALLVYNYLAIKGAINGDDENR